MWTRPMQDPSSKPLIIRCFDFLCRALARTGTSYQMWREMPRAVCEYVRTYKTGQQDPAMYVRTRLPAYVGQIMMPWTSISRETACTYTIGAMAWTVWRQDRIVETSIVYHPRPAYVCLLCTALSFFSSTRWWHSPICIKEQWEYKSSAEEKAHRPDWPITTQNIWHCSFMFLRFLLHDNYFYACMFRLKYSYSTLRLNWMEILFSETL